MATIPRTLDAVEHSGPQLQVGSRVSVRDPQRVLPRSHALPRYDALALATLKSDKRLAWCDGEVSTRDFGNVVAIDPTDMTDPIALVALDNNRGLIATPARALRPLTWRGMRFMILPQQGEHFGKWRAAALESFPGLEAYVDPAYVSNQIATVHDVRMHKLYPGQYPLLCRLTEVTRGTVRYSSIGANGALVPPSVDAVRDAGGSVYTVLHGVEVRDPGNYMPQKRERKASRSRNASRNASRQQSPQRGDGTGPRNPPRPPPVAGTSANYAPRGYGSDAFAAKLRSDPGYAEQVLAEPVPEWPKGQGLWQCRVVRPTEAPGDMGDELV